MYNCFDTVNNAFLHTRNTGYEIITRGVIDRKRSLFYKLLGNKTSVYNRGLVLLLAYVPQQLHNFHVKSTSCLQGKNKDSFLIRNVKQMMMPLLG